MRSKGNPQRDNRGSVEGIMYMMELTALEGNCFRIPHEGLGMGAFSNQDGIHMLFKKVGLVCRKSAGMFAGKAPA